MIALAWILTLAAAARIDLVDEIYSIPADQWRYVPVSLKQQPAVVLAHYDAIDGSAPVRLVLMRSEDLENFRDNLPHGMIAVSGPGRSGTLRAEAPQGDYVLVLDNQTESGHTATVHLRLWLDFTKAPVVTELSRERQLTVIIISLAVFCGIAGWSLRRIWKTINKPQMNADERR